jgi:hypothetical protein
VAWKPNQAFKKSEKEGARFRKENRPFAFAQTHSTRSI